METLTLKKTDERPCFSCVSLPFPNKRTISRWRVAEPAHSKVPLYGDHISSRKAQAMKQAKDRKKQLFRPGPDSNRDLSLPGLEKQEPEFVSDVEITELHAFSFLSLITIWLKFVYQFER